MIEPAAAPHTPLMADQTAVSMRIRQTDKTAFYVCSKGTLRKQTLQPKSARVSLVRHLKFCLPLPAKEDAIWFLSLVCQVCLQIKLIGALVPESSICYAAHLVDHIHACSTPGTICRSFAIQHPS